MAIKLLEDHLIHLDGDDTSTKLAEVSSTGLTMISSSVFSASKITASAGLCVTGSVRFLSNGTDNPNGPEEIEFTTDEVKVTGSLTVTGDFTVLGTQSLGDTETDSLSVAGTATVTNDLNVQGSTALSGAVTLGNATGDDLTFTGRVASHVVPSSDAAYDLGSSALGFNDLHLGSGGVINLDGGDVTLTHAAGKLTWGGDGAVEIDFNNHEMTNVDIDSGAIDGTVIGANSAAAGTFAAIVGTSLDCNGAGDFSDTLTLSKASGNGLVVTSNADINGDLDVDGTTNLDAVDIDGAVQVDNTITVGADDQGYDVKFFGDTASAYMLWDTSADDLILGGAAGLIVPDGKLTLNATAVTATATELNYNDITTLGTAERSKVVTADASDKITLGAFEIEGSNFDVNGGNIDGTTIGAASPAAANVTTLTASSLAVMDGMTFGFGFDPGGDGGGGSLQIGANTKSITSSVYATWRPGADDEYDLGASGAEWKDLYLDGVAYVDELQADALGAALNCASQAMTNVNVDSGAIDGVTIGSNSAATALTVNGGTVSITDTGGDGAIDGCVIGANTAAAATVTTLSATGDVDLGNATSDTITATGRFDSDLVPSTDNARDLGASGLEWKDLYLDGVAYVDDLRADTLGAALDANDQAITNINVDSGAIDGTVIGANSAAAGTFAAIVGTSLNVSDGNITNVGSIACDSVTSDAATGLSLDGSSVTTSGGFAVSMPDNLAIGFQVMQGADAYMKFVTTDGSEAITVHEDLTLDNDKDAKARSFITYSDATLKQDIKPLDSALDKVMSMRGVSYEFKNQASADGSSHREVGFLAQEMKQTVPEVVYGNGDGNLGIDYAKLTSVLVEAVKAQQGQIEELRAALLKK